jgi:2-keto-3-deoxy-L-rhamnonate aldolase RhmA
MILSWQQIPSSIISEILCKNLDGVVLDLEHGMFNLDELFSCIQVIKLSKRKCFVRLPDISKSNIKYCLDSGCDGIIFSTVENKKQCEEIIKNCHYPKIGKRGFGLVRQNFWGENKTFNSKPIIIPQIETEKSVRNLKDIIKFNFSYYLIGPYDLSASLNCLGSFEDPKFLQSIEKIESLVPRNRLGIHIPKDIKKEIFKYEDYGLKCLGMDTTAILDFYKNIKDTK